MNRNWVALNNEASFVRSALGLGVTQIQYANYADLGIYWQSFTNISVGLERLAKLTILLDCFLNKGSFPDFKTLKRFGHKLNDLYGVSREIVDRNNIEFDYISILDNEIHKNILSVLTDFANGDRYANLDFLTGESDKNPVLDWSKNVDEWIWENKISEKSKNKIRMNASLWNLIPCGCFFITETNKVIRKAEEASILTGKWQAIAPYRKLYIVEVVRYWVEILIWLQNSCHRKGLEVPYFGEYFPLFLQNDAYIKRRKNWTKIY